MAGAVVALAVAVGLACAICAGVGEAVATAQTQSVSTVHEGLRHTPPKQVSPDAQSLVV